MRVRWGGTGVGKGSGGRRRVGSRTEERQPRAWCTKLEGASQTERQRWQGPQVGISWLNLRDRKMRVSQQSSFAASCEEVAPRRETASSCGGTVHSWGFRQGSLILQTYTTITQISGILGLVGREVLAESRTLGQGLERWLSG